MNLVEDERRELERLWGEVSELRTEIDRLTSENRLLAEKRRLLYKKIRELKLEAMKLREEHNALNEEVKILRASLAGLKEEYRGKLIVFGELRHRIREYLRAKPNMDEESIKKEISEIDWRIQTSTISLEKENKLIKRIKSLEVQLIFYHKLKVMENEAAALGDEIKKIRDEIASCKNKIAENIVKSRELRKQIAEYFDKISVLRTEADKLYKTYLENRNKLSSLRLKYVELLAKITAVKKRLREEEERKREKVLAALREKIEKKALEKLNRGEKLSFEEFKILIERGKIKAGFESG